MHHAIGSLEHPAVFLAIHAPTHKYFRWEINGRHPVMTGKALSHCTMKYTNSIFIRREILSKR